MKRFIILFIITALLGVIGAEELPKPTYDNSLVLSMTHSFLVETPTEIETIKSYFPNGLYAPLAFSKFVKVPMDWDVNINSVQMNEDMVAFKTEVDQIVAFAKQYNVGVHLTMTYGIARDVKYYATAKQEDVRNAMWYNDNNISGSSQQSRTTGEATGSTDSSGLSLDHVAEFRGTAEVQASTSIINKYVFATFSRYARKLRGHLEAKITAAFDYLAQIQNANPDVLIIVSAPGESELNFFRMNEAAYMQTYFCDYSPFAVMEFRDWIKHEGLYAAGEKYAGEGYSGGGSRYQDASGLSNFNSDFGTSFTSWDLKYYNWSLADAVDTNYTDGSDPDPNALPVSFYAYNAMMPTGGAYHTSGGFDPPRTMSQPGTSSFYDLWEAFRQNLTGNYVKDMVGIARASGFNKDRNFTHQIPGDYLFGTRPNDPAIPNLNPRYYTSASPLWTAKPFSDTGAGVTLYDVNFGSWIARTTQYGIAGANALSTNWAALEYNPEVLPNGISASVSPVSTIYGEMIRLYNGNPHVISFFKWIGDSYAFKDTNRGTAAQQFFQAVKDKARQATSTVFTPKKVENVSASYNSNTYLVELSWSSKIWTGLSHLWSHWGDFKEFVIYRGYSENFTANSSSEITRLSAGVISYSDFGFTRGTTVYYKVAAVNVNNVVGTVQTVSVAVPAGNPVPILSVSRERLNFTYLLGQDNPPAQTFRVTNTGTGALSWSTTEDAGWLVSTPTSGINSATVTVSADPAGLVAGTYIAPITVSATGATNSPQTLDVYLTVKSTTEDLAPVGEFSSPGDFSDAASSIPVTGWVVDDVGVEKVTIYRDPITGEGNNRMYIGEAIFVEGARDDVAALYPDYPYNYQAGWGYMLLTNFLPNGGNGTFKLHAIVTDTRGREFSLGSKSIVCDNENAVKPFGAIDFPSQGGTASGNYRNHGWVLTPMPNVIPFDGSTIDVYIESVKVGSLTYYGVPRPDIRQLFPGYANSAAAGGYYDIDTTSFKEDVYSIAWLATDNAGNTDGIGSRFFSIRNSADAQSAQQANSVRSASNSIIPRQKLMAGLPLDTTGVKRFVKPKSHRRGDTANHLVPKKDGWATITVSELERIELLLGPDAEKTPSGTYSGYSSVGGMLKRLPLGSTLDTEKGIFYWIPAPGFIGDYNLEFLVPGGPGESSKIKQVKIRILPKSNGMRNRNLK